MLTRAKNFYSRYERYTPAAFFVAGFLFDVITLGRIDAIESIALQGAYLALLLFMLGQYFLELELGRPLSSRFRFYVRFRIEAIHFVFGSLLSSFTLFYFMSASLSASLTFLCILSVLLVINELPQFHGLGLGFKFALLALCLMSYFAYLVPILLGTMGTFIFLFSIALGIVPLYFLGRILLKKGMPPVKVRVQVFRPVAVIVIVFLLSYLFRLIPPVPLSIKYMGVYHGVSKSNNVYQLEHERPWWRFWQSGDQWFEAQPGDKVIVFFRLFSPTRFSDTVELVWYLKEPRRGWTKQDAIPIKIAGGRDEGFRGYGVKSNYTDGEWRAVVQTTDKREIGRIHFSLKTVPAAPREFKFDYH